jgi:hypothetical protein
MGSTLLYVTAASLYRAFEFPFIVGGVGILFGYLQAWAQKADRIQDEAYLKFFQRYELESLLRGKRRTLRKYNTRIVEKYQLDASILDYDRLEQ